MKLNFDTKKEEGTYLPLAELARKAGADGFVLLKNEENLLPLKSGSNISVFGRGQKDYYEHGLGSGGLVNTEYSVNIIDALTECGNFNINMHLANIYKNWIADNSDFASDYLWQPGVFAKPEMILTDELVKSAREKSDTAIIIIGRCVGEAKDNSAEKGGWYLSDNEDANLSLISKYFENTVAIMNTSGIIDMNWVEKYNIKSVLYVWHGGQESGNSIADVLCGKVNPSGRLTDTIAKDIYDYPSTENFGGDEQNFYKEDIYVGYRYFETFAPEKVLYPFGFGLSYTSFDISLKDVSEDGEKIQINAEIKNTGNCSGREVVQVYFEAPQGKLGKSVRELCAFVKTGLIEPGKTEPISIEFNIDSMAAYDDCNVTGNKSCYVLEAGEYNICMGANVRNAEKIYTYTVNELKVTRQLEEILAPITTFDILYPLKGENGYEKMYKKVSQRTVDYNERINKELPKEIVQTGDRGIKFIDVKNGKNTMDEFVAQLSAKDLMCMVKGEGMSSHKIRPGCAGAIGGVTKSLCEYGIPIMAVCDGPSGIRLDSGESATSLPCGTALASTWDTTLIEQLYEFLSAEMCIRKVDALLGPGINIHRNPLGGRNFEYLSEDPLLTGKIAAAIVRGIASYGNSATIKHFMGNSQEYKRSNAVSQMSERAAREIYLKGFEIAVCEGDARAVMTSYNPVNDIWTVNNYELNTIVLRKEWNFKGFVMSDWWAKTEKVKGEKLNLADMVRAQNDVYMVVADTFASSDNLEENLKDGVITLGQLQRNVTNILRHLMSTKSYNRFIERGGGMEPQLSDKLESLSIIEEFESPKLSENLKIQLEESGRYLIGVGYSSNESELAQIKLAIHVNVTNTTIKTVNGTDGKLKMVYHEISAHMGELNLSLSYPEELMKVEKLILMK